MRRVVIACSWLVLTAVAPCAARAEVPCPPSSGPSAVRAAPAAEPAVESPVARARELLGRAKLLDEEALVDERVAADLDKRLPGLRDAAKAARAASERARPEAKDAALARAETLEADLAVSEIEVGARRRSAGENRRVARELRERAVRVARGEPPKVEPARPPLYLPAASDCAPPYAFTPDGRKVYKLECL